MRLVHVVEGSTMIDSHLHYQVKTPTLTSKLALGRSFGCAIGADARVWCWGVDNAGQLGREKRDPADGAWVMAPLRRARAVAGLKAEDKVEDIVALPEGACARTASKRWFCWGSDGSSPDRAGARSAVFQVANAPVIGATHIEAFDGISRLAFSTGFDAWACGRTTSAVRCWGDIPGGRQKPRQVTGVPPGGQLLLSQHVASILSEAGLWMWGNRRFTRVDRYAGPAYRWDALRVDALGKPETVAMTTTTACASATDGSVHCVGAQGDGAVLEDVRLVVAGQQFFCALRRVGTVACWGFGDRGELGDATTTPFEQPVEIAVKQVEQLALGDRFACTRRGDGSVHCWGEGFGPSPVAVLTKSRTIKARFSQVCSINFEHQIECLDNSLDHPAFQPDYAPAR